MTADIGFGFVIGFFLIGAGLACMGFSPAWMLVGVGVGLLFAGILAYLNGPKKDSEDD